MVFTFIWRFRHVITWIPRSANVRWKHFTHDLSPNVNSTWLAIQQPVAALFDLLGIHACLTIVSCLYMCCLEIETFQKDVRSVTKPEHFLLKDYFRQTILVYLKFRIVVDFSTWIFRIERSIRNDVVYSFPFLHPSVRPVSEIPSDTHLWYLLILISCCSRT